MIKIGVPQKLGSLPWIKSENIGWKNNVFYFFKAQENLNKT